jgi:hypothetical protein
MNDWPYSAATVLFHAMPAQRALLADTEPSCNPQAPSEAGLQTAKVVMSLFRVLGIQPIQNDHRRR